MTTDHRFRLDTRADSAQRAEALRAGALAHGVVSLHKPCDGAQWSSPAAALGACEPELATNAIPVHFAETHAFQLEIRIGCGGLMAAAAAIRAP